MPSTFDDQNSHGTRCAGAAVANANNSVCGVGVAYDAQIAGILNKLRLKNIELI